MDWTQIVVPNPVERCSHTTVVVGEKIYVICGWSLKALKRFAEIKIWDARQNKWSSDRFLIFIKALPRIGTNLTAAAVVGSKIIIYGGFTGDGSIANAVSFDTNTGSITNVPNQSKLPARSAQSMSVIGNDIFVFGGLDDDTVATSTLFKISKQFNVKLIDQTGVEPLPCFNHSATVVDKYIYIFGGSVDFFGNHVRNTLHCFDTKKSTWLNLEVTGTPPKARGFHKATKLPDNKIVIFGGGSSREAFNDLFVLDVAKPLHPVWHSIGWPANGVIPKPRMAHSFDYIQSENKIVLIGGSVDWGGTTENFDDVWHLKVYNSPRKLTDLATKSILVSHKSDKKHLSKLPSDLIQRLIDNLRLKKLPHFVTSLSPEEI